MARASKSKKEKATATGEWAKVAEASAAAHDEDDDTGNDGVIHEGGGPVYLEKLSPEARAAASELQAAKYLEYLKAQQSAKDAAAVVRKDLEARRKELKMLAEEIESGVRKVEAQADLPGVQ